MANIVLSKPQAGFVQSIVPHADDTLTFNFTASDATLERDGDNLNMSFEDGASIVLEGFYEQYTSENMPTFFIEGTEVSGEDFFAGLAEDLMPAAGVGQAQGSGSNVDLVQTSLQDGLQSLDGLDQDGSSPQQDSSGTEAGAPIASTAGETAPQDSSTAPETPKVPVAPPVSLNVEISINDIAEDNIINAEEAAQDVLVSGTVTGDYKEGDTVTLTVNGQDFTGEVDADGNYEIAVPGKDLAEGGDVSASITVSDDDGNSATHSADKDVASDLEVGGDLTGSVTSSDDTIGQAQVVEGIGLPEDTSYNFENGVNVGDADNPFGSFSVNENGELVFTQNENYVHPEGGEDASLEVSIPVKDTSGNESSVTVSLSVADGKPQVTAESEAKISESQLSDGTEAGGESVTATGSVDMDFGNDGQGSFAWNSEGQPNITTTEGVEVVWSVDGDVLTGTADGKEVISVTMQTENGSYTGEYTVELKESISHDEQGKDSDNLNFGFTITDGDGSVAAGNAQVQVQDDAPVNENVIIDLAPGDNLIGQNVYGQGADASALKDAVSGDESIANKYLTFSTGGQNSVTVGDGETGFTIKAAMITFGENGTTIDAEASKNLELGWRDDHNAKYGDGISINDSTTNNFRDMETSNIEGNDVGDQAEAIIIELPEGSYAYGVDISFECLFSSGGTEVDTSDETVLIEFYKDGELVYSADVRGSGGSESFNMGTVTVPFDEVRVIPNNEGSDFVIDSIDFSNYSDLVVGQGAGQLQSSADGMVDAYFESISIGDDSVDFARAADGSVSINGDNTLTLEDGTELTLSLNGDVLMGTNADGQNYFTATVDGEGNWVVYQHEAFGDQIKLELGSVDGDGDVQNHSITMNGNDAPVVGDVISSAVVSESDLVVDAEQEGTEGAEDAENAESVAVGQVELDFGNDGQGSFEWNTGDQPSLQTTEGVEITWIAEGNVLKGMAGETEVLSVTMDPSSGEYTVQLSESIEHADVQGQNSSGDLNFGFTITDSNGNSASGSATVEIEDDVANIATDNQHTVESKEIVTEYVRVPGTMQYEPSESVEAEVFVFDATFNPESGTASVSGTMDVEGADGVGGLEIGLIAQGMQGTTPTITVDGSPITFIEFTNEDGISTIIAGVTNGWNAEIGNWNIPDPYFTVSLDPSTGQWDFNQYKEFDSSITLKFSATDGDGDTDVQYVEVKPSNTTSGNDDINIDQMSEGTVVGDAESLNDGDQGGDDTINIENMAGGTVAGDGINMESGSAGGDDVINVETMSGGNIYADGKDAANAEGGDDTVSVVNFSEAARAYIDGGDGDDTFVFDTDMDSYIDFSNAGFIEIGGQEDVDIVNFENLTTGSGDDLIKVDAGILEGTVDSGAGFDIVVAEGGVTDTELSDILQGSLNTEMFIFSKDSSITESTSTEEALGNLNGVETSETGVSFGDNWTQGESSTHNGTEYQSFTDEATETTVMVARAMLENVTS